MTIGLEFKSKVMRMLDCILLDVRNIVNIIMLVFGSSITIREVIPIVFIRFFLLIMDSSIFS
jgi:hypothetical protein